MIWVVYHLPLTPHCLLFTLRRQQFSSIILSYYVYYLYYFDDSAPFTYSTTSTISMYYRLLLTALDLGCEIEARISLAKGTCPERSEGG